MDFGRRRTQKYTSKSHRLEDIRELGDLVADPIGVKDRYGRLLSLLKTNMTNGILATLVQFYDPLYHCFTFSDYQLMPTLKEYSYLLGLPISDQIPFSGLKEIPKVKVISEATHLKMSDIKAHMITKGGILGLPTKFLMDKARYFASMKSMDAFKAILALLIYGLFLFPNVDNFVVNAIKIFLMGNPVPTLLADTYHSIHIRNSYSGGMIICCVPLLYKWLISHLPQSTAFWDLKDEYRRQLGYPMKDKPSNILLEGLFFKEGKYKKALKEKIVHAWCHVHKKRREVLGKPNYVSLEPYLQWVQAKAIKLKMPYPFHGPFPIAAREPTLIFMTDAEKLRIALTKVPRERDTWKNKNQFVNNENEELQKHLKKKNEEDLASKKRKV
ncbi:uncharacterized protein LOC127136643 [Lathyrus oleraceus]|uniref:uncharacterized protein LOC127136643 n=1 Tax=Pisum sativum TaxID=3888 RepID=UPI0021CDF3E8|nr:uncharacterized protein LOC127136643 [Pisum sativum]